MLFRRRFILDTPFPRTYYASQKVLMVLPPLELFSLRKELPCCRAALSVFGHFFGISRIIEPLCRVADVKRPTADRGPLYYWMEIWCVLCGRRIFSTHSV